MRWFLCASAALTLDCSVDENGIGAPNPNEAGFDSPVTNGDGGADVFVESAPPQPCSVQPGACVNALPAGWMPIAFSGAPSAACPSNYIGANVVHDPIAQVGACDCSCNVSQTPACDVGSLQRYISADSSCGTPGVLLPVNGPGCNVLTMTGPLAAYGKAAPIAATGGACSGSPVTNIAKVTTTSARSCTPPTQCEEQLCLGDVPTGFGTCLSMAGAQPACPVGWGTPLVVGDAPQLTCSACTCDVSGSSCTNAALTFFGDVGCNASMVTVPIDNVCDLNSAAGQSPAAYKYTATLNAVCNAAGPKTPTATSVSNPQTICCKP